MTNTATRRMARYNSVKAEASRLDAAHAAKVAAVKALKAFAEDNSSFVQPYDRADGTTVRAHVRNGVSAHHDVYGKGTVAHEDVNSGKAMVRFAVGRSGKFAGKIITVGRSALTF